MFGLYFTFGILLAEINISLQACEPGYYQYFHYGCYRCRSACIQCTSYNRCSECVAGKRGTNCQENCPAGCTGDVCDQTTGVCSNGCQSGYHGTSQGCPCPDNCRNSVCSSDTGACTVGCNVGFYGWKCNYICPTECKNNVCDKGTGSCIDGCENGYHGSSCNLSCPANCKENVCEQGTGLCSQGCDDGYYGNKCEQSCSTNCSRCSDYDYCTGCKNGHFRNSGSCYACQTGCSICYQAAWCSTCSDGYYKNNFGECQTCPVSCTKCYSTNGCTECRDGYYQSGDSCPACRTGCAECSWSWNCPQGTNCYYSDWCSSCTVGFYLSESRCNQCPDHCESCTGLNYCSSCVAGFHGSYCQDGCPTNCKGKSCNKDNGQCDETCDEGYYGENCNLSCPAGCKACLNSSYCTECYPGHTGPVCCPDNCRDGRCNADTGKCISGCIDGYYGNNCYQTCDEHCISCLQGTGDCNNCTAGYYGNKCSETCSSGCALTEGKLVCDIEGGVCSNGCKVTTKHGSQCNQDCGQHCVDRECDQFTASCHKGCQAGFYGDTCNDACSEYCANITCHRGNGTCVLGCEDGYTGHACTQVQAATGEDSSSSTVAGAAGGAVAAVVVIAVVVVAILIFRRRRNQRQEESKQVDSPMPDEVSAKPPPPIYSNVILDGNASVVTISNPEYERPPTVSFANARDERAESQELPDDPDPDADDYGDGSVPPEVSPDNAYYNTDMIGRPIKLDDLPAYVKQKSPNKYKQEFGNLPKNLYKPYKESRKTENLRKNRYKGIYPYDETRVVLKDGGPDYINASYIDGFNRPKAYIAALGTIEETITDFWRMIWQEQTGKIVMLTKLTEAGTKKCWQYWPDKGATKRFGAVTVTTDAEDDYAEFKIRSFSVQNGGEKRKVIHVHYTAWPDKGVPADVTGLVEFRQKVQATATDLPGPVIVHCSAGIGRTGTFIALDDLTMEGQAEGYVNVLGCVLKLREHRVNMVQTEEQYEYLHHAVVHSLTFDCQNVSADRFQPHYLKVTKPVQGGVPILQQKFQQLQETVETNAKDEVSMTKNKTFNRKNRPDSCVPADRYRPRLHLGIREGDLDYINAVYINSYRAKNAFIVTQTPLPDTIVDFWRLVFQERTPCIVMMEDDGGKEANAYWPSGNRSVKFGPFSISKTESEANSDFAKNKLSVTFKGSETHEVTHFTIKSWAQSDAVPKPPSSFLQLLEAVERESPAAGGDGPNLVHCLDGATRSGLFCAVSVLVEKIKVEQEVSVVNTIRQMKSRRRQIVPNYEQYKFCHVAVNAYLDSFNTYSNFTLKM